MTAAAPTRREIAGLGAILIVASAIRIATAGYPLWFDELASLVFAHQPLGHLWSGWMVRESNPPLYYSLLKGWIGAFGDGDRAVRLLSILIGIGGIVAGWALARRLGGAFAGLAAASLMAVSTADVAFSQEVRGYALAHAATLVALIGAVDFLDTRRRHALLLYAAATLVALYSHTTMILFAGLTGVAVLWLVRQDRRALGGWLVGNAAILIGWAWWAAITVRQLAAPRGTFGWIPSLGPAASLRVVERAYLPDFLGQGGLAGDLLLLALALCLAGLLWRDRRPAVALLGWLVLAAPLALVAASHWHPVLIVRTLFWASGPLIVLVALMLAEIGSPRAAGAVLALLVVFEAALLVHWLPARQLESWPSALDAIGRAAPGSVMLVDGDAMALAAAHYLPADDGLTLVALRRPAGGSNEWAKGLYRGPHVDDAGAVALLRGRGRLSTLTIGDQDPGRVLNTVGERRLWRAASRGEQPFVWIWRAR